MDMENMHLTKDAEDKGGSEEDPNNSTLQGILSQYHIQMGDNLVGDIINTSQNQALLGIRGELLS